LTLAVQALPFSPSRPPPRTRRRPGVARLLDVLVIACGVAVLAIFVVRANTTLGYRWNWTVIPTFLVRTDPATGRLAPNLLLLGFFTTIRLAVWSLVIGTPLGVLLAAMRVYGRPALRWLSRAIVEVIRDTPPIVLIFVLYFFVSSQLMPLLGIDRALAAAPPAARAVVAVVASAPDRINDFLSGVACLGLLAAVYIAEIVRSGVQSVPLDQIEAGRALGLRGWAVFRLLVMPQALRNVLPALAGQFIVSIKDSSLVALISIPELTYMTSEVSDTTQRFFEVWLFTAGLYFCLCFSCATLFRRLERRWVVRR
jgi:polar amino acid transport system permease protein